MARLRDVVFDCAQPSALARFWAAALDGYEIAPYDAPELERLRSQGIEDPEDDPAVLVESAFGGPRFWFSLAPSEKPVKNRVHVDLLCGDVLAETARLVALGAFVTLAPDDDRQHAVLQDPEGNEFCLFP